MKVNTASERYNIEHRVSCENAQLCEVDIVTLTDLESINQKKKVYFSGALHGDEVIGPNAVYYFIEYMLKSASEPSTQHILENVTVILTPMTNAPGYHFHEREERLSPEAQA